MSSVLNSTFTREELETLIEAIGDWELLGNQEYNFSQMIKSAPMPPEDHEAFEIMNQIKEHFRSREKEINDSREVRQEKAVFLKAKLMLVRRDLAIDKLFDFAKNTNLSEEPAEAPAVAPDVADKKLKQAEHFIRDLGVWPHYEKFLEDQKKD